MNTMDGQEDLSYSPQPFETEKLFSLVSNLVSNLAGSSICQRSSSNRTEVHQEMD